MTERFLCDDCLAWYDGPAYYSWDPAQVPSSPPHSFCTGNYCVSCADDLYPDDLNDPRVPERIRPFLVDA